MSTSAPEIGLPFWSLTTQLTKRAGPGVGERTIDPPFSVRGEFMRQNGPSRLAVVSVCPLLPLLRRQIKVENQSNPTSARLHCAFRRSSAQAGRHIEPPSRTLP